ncbi:hypothetical protein PAMC26510_32785 [Caballeronia sordidicola]|uniref:Uncharacterized protein n=1 Tax=Caballeronia sordidicola TaxID=196367 RepID=A0A242M7I7_CABSO|nr:hypothetical protein PAMC26510_32785 [Caballeronia sordidicola]
MKSAFLARCLRLTERSRHVQSLHCAIALDPNNYAAPLKR